MLENPGDPATLDQVPAVDFYEASATRLLPNAWIETGWRDGSQQNMVFYFLQGHTDCCSGTPELTALFWPQVWALISLSSGEESSDKHHLG